MQAIAVRKKAEKLRAQLAANAPKEETREERAAVQRVPCRSSPLFEVLNEEERDALVAEMDLETHDEGSVIISEGRRRARRCTSSPAGEVKVFTRGAGGSTRLSGQARRRGFLRRSERADRKTSHGDDHRLAAHRAAPPRQGEARQRAGEVSRHPQASSTTSTSGARSTRSRR